jgi:hypothetical protein
MFSAWQCGFKKYLRADLHMGDKPSISCNGYDKNVLARILVLIRMFNNAQQMLTIYKFDNLLKANLALLF